MRASAPEAVLNTLNCLKSESHETVAKTKACFSIVTIQRRTKRGRVGRTWEVPPVARRQTNRTSVRPL